MKTHNKLKLESPAIYQIIVQGKVDPSLSQMLSEFQINKELTEDEAEKTLMVGKVTDQAALSGILNTLYEMHLPVLSVECLKQL